MTSHFTPPIPSAVLIPSPVNRKELAIMTAWQYSGAGMINNYVAIGYQYSKRINFHAYHENICVKLK